MVFTRMSTLMHTWRERHRNKPDEPCAKLWVTTGRGEAPLTRHTSTLSEPRFPHLQNGGLAYVTFNCSVGAKDK